MGLILSLSMAALPRSWADQRNSSARHQFPTLIVNSTAELICQGHGHCWGRTAARFAVQAAARMRGGERYGHQQMVVLLVLAFNEISHCRNEPIAVLSAFH